MGKGKAGVEVASAKVGLSDAELAKSTEEEEESSVGGGVVDGGGDVRDLD